MPGSVRKQKAQQTRLRMLRAAHELFVERGYTGTRMVDVAQAAGVAVQTLYFTFHSKPELLQACYERAVLGEEDPRPPNAQPWYEALMAAATGTEALRHFAEGNGTITARVGVLDDVTRSASHEPEAVEVRRHSEALRRDGYTTIVHKLEQSFGLRPGLSPQEATDLMLALAGAAIYRTLVVDFGWTHQRYTDWLAGTLVEQVLAPAARA